MGRAAAIGLLFVAACGRLGFEDGAAGGGGDDTMMPPPDDGMARITVQRTGDGTGTVMGANAFTCNTASCTVDVPIGSAMWLRGVAQTGAWFAGWAGMCGGNFECKFDVTADVTIMAEFSSQPNRVFVTSTATNGALGGIVGADAMCNARAMAAGMTPTFIAYMSDSTTNAITRLGSARGWVRMDGAPYADLSTAFAQAAVIYPPRLDEFGQDVGDVGIYTGTNGGNAIAETCTDWTSADPMVNGGITLSHFARASTFGWGDTCDSGHRLLCIETARNVPVAIHRDETSKLVFASRSLFAPGNGRAAADAICATEATNDGLPGTYLAAVSTTTESIQSRFAPGSIYRRVDGVRVVNDTTLFTTSWFDVPVELDTRGMFVDNDYWTGTARFDTASTMAQNCEDWANGSNAIDGNMHHTVYTDMRSSAKREPCGTPLPVLCIQE